MNSETFQIIVWIGKRRDLCFATVARTGIELPNVECLAQRGGVDSKEVVDAGPRWWNRS